MSIKRVIRNISCSIRGFRWVMQVKAQPQDNGRKNVLLMITHMGRNGAQRVASYLASGLADVSNVYLLTSGIKKEPWYPIDSRVTVLAVPGLLHVFFEYISASMIRLLKRRLRIDVSFSMLYSLNKYNVMSKGSERVIVSERNNPMKNAPKHFSSTKKIYAAADYVIFQTEEVRSLYDSRVREHSCVLPNPVAVSCMASDIRKPRIVNVGRLHHNKNQEMLIRAFAAFLPEHPEYELSIYGDGPLKNYLKKVVRDLGLEEKVIFHGNVADIHEQIADAAMFVLSSDIEGLPNALLEAMMMGLPCISTACTGAKDVVRDGFDGLLTEPGNTEQLTEAMCRMADHPDQAEQMRKNAVKTTEVFQKDRVMKQWLRTILE